MATQEIQGATIDVNFSGGIYVRGRAYGIETKHRVWETFKALKEARVGNDPSHREVASVANVSKSYVSNVLKEP